ncbi:hypothetical protein DL96DRAFT_1716033 [Flagelloscypha sp. PMI_526]|nr:hypothetical protein DL96DRAFT_1716033 [Flagelloscypha sp. PMI_526]
MADLPLDPNTSGTVLSHSLQYLRAFEQKQKVDAIPSQIPRAPSPPSNELAGPKRVLALDGGGLFGIAEMLLLRDIIGGPNKRPCDYFDLIAGSGTGGIFAILLARFELTIKESIDIFENLMEPLRNKIKDGKTSDTKVLTADFAKSLSSTIFQLIETCKAKNKDRKTSDQLSISENSLKCKA